MRILDALYVHFPFTAGSSPAQAAVQWPAGSQGAVVSAGEGHWDQTDRTADGTEHYSLGFGENVKKKKKSSPSGGGGSHLPAEK